MTRQLAVYRHEAFPYAGHNEFIAFSAAFLRDGVMNRERGLIIAVDDKLSAVRDELGGDADLVSFVDMAVAGRNPARILSVIQQCIDADPYGGRLRAIGEPVHSRRSPDAIFEAQLHELLLNSPVCQTWDVWLGCPYDTAALDDDVLSAMRASHPFVAGDPVALDGPSALVEQMFGTQLAPPPTGARRLNTGPDGLAAARAFVRRGAIQAGLDTDRVENLVFAVNEVVTNSVRHGDAAVRLALWLDRDALICDVRDGGVISDPLVGRVLPGPAESRGRGLWLVNHFCDLVQVRSSAAGTVVRMRVEF